ncbi:hypothetical protein SELMODRAFT_130479 [Selaginella moellendorffii]|uniref:MORN repeat-containing protein 3 n=1 Tax=Selaginella moellendorffii TaxID=88036 RepID=D8T2H4_SELML|nr:hypothetical protein SELMODRAFT_130479 [Selaginella moellendorffii]
MFTTKEVPLALARLQHQPQPVARKKPEHWYRRKFKEREQQLEKQKKSAWRINDLRANKNGFHHDVYWITQDLYRGNWRLNKKEGSGIQSYCTGNRYEGDWKKDRREGYGTFYIREDGKYRVVYKGYWKSGNLHGPGYLHCAYGEVYEGDFERGVRSGYGRQTYYCPQSGRYHVYVGQWRDDKREGTGTLTVVNGDVYEGCFSNDKKHGKGVFYYTTSRCRYDGLWREDVAICGTYSKMESDYEFKTPLPHLELRNADTFASCLIDKIVQDDGLQILSC